MIIEIWDTVSQFSSRGAEGGMAWAAASRGTRNAARAAQIRPAVTMDWRVRITLAGSLWPAAPLANFHEAHHHHGHHHPEAEAARLRDHVPTVAAPLDGRS